jgi:hypothetical protein
MKKKHASFDDRMSCWENLSGIRGQDGSLALGHDKGTKGTFRIVRASKGVRLRYGFKFPSDTVGL